LETPRTGAAGRRKGNSTVGVITCFASAGGVCAVRQSTSASATAGEAGRRKEIKELTLVSAEQGCQVCVTKPAQWPMKTSPKPAQWPIKPAQYQNSKYARAKPYTLLLKSNSIAIIAKCIVISTK